MKFTNKLLKFGIIVAESQPSHILYSDLILQNLTKMAFKSTVFIFTISFFVCFKTLAWKVAGGVQSFKER